MPIATGYGTVKTAHGILAIPAPATALLLKGLPLTRGPAKKELTTPTGAALLKAFCHDFDCDFSGTLSATSYGAGKMDFPSHPNVIKVSLFETASNSDSDETISVLTCTIDDMSSEILAHTFTQLFDEGALDAVIHPCQMKKNRPAQRLEVLCQPKDQTRLAQFILKETSSFGLRIRSEKRLILEREIKTLETPYGPVHFKFGYLHGELIKVTPEYEDAVSIARDQGRSLTKVFAKLHAIADSLLS